MAGIRLDIMDIRQLIQLKIKGYSNRKSAELLSVNRKTIDGYVGLFKSLGIRYSELLELDEKSLQDLFPNQSEVESLRYEQLSQYFPYFERELKKPGCTLQALWREYLNKHPDGYRHSRFNHHFNEYRQKVKASCKLEHKAGERLFIDFTGKKLEVVDKQTGEIARVNVFVGILPCSQQTFVHATKTQGKEDLIGAVVKCLEYFGGSPAAIVSDNLKAAVSRASKYEPVINRSFKDPGLHYGCSIDPARPYSPQDKAMVEGAVKLVYQRIFYPLGKHIFFSLESLNEQIGELTDQYNNCTLSQRSTTRNQEFPALEKQYLQPLPKNSYCLKAFKRLTVQKMGHICLSEDKHYYSVPYRFRGKRVEVQYTGHTVEVYFDRERIALHPRDARAGKYSTNKEHLSSHHKAYSEWNMDFFVGRARHIGEHAQEYVRGMILQRNYPETAYKQAQGILMLTKQYTPQRVDMACKRALAADHYSYRTIKKILENRMDQQPGEDSAQVHIPFHENIRGSDHYQ